MKYFTKSFLIIALIALQHDASNSQTADGMTKQQFLPASPDAAALGKFGDVPVTMNTGVPGISVPFYEIKEGNITLPVSFSYNASGIKVQQEATIVGLGWSLNAGGTITRIVRGLADDRAVSGFFTTRTQINQLINGTLSDPTNILRGDIASGRIDAQPDLYIGNIGGLTFKFAMDSNGVFRTIPHSNIKIQYAQQLGGETKSGYFTVTDGNGNSYRFGGFIPGEGNNSPVYFSEYNAQSTQVPHKDISAWYIREIKPVNGNTIKFDYINSLQKSYINQSYTAYYEPPGRNVPCPAENKIPPPTYNPSSSNQWVPVLKKITWTQGTVEFYCMQDRTDNGTMQRLTSIRVFSADGLTLAQCDLTQDYFTGANGGRLRLKKIQTGKDYTDDITGQLVKVPVYSFEYDDRPLPYIESLEQDHWGYYNASGNTHLTPSVKIYNPITSAWTTIPNTANRNVNPAAVTIGLLKKITYPTGGSTSFEYESNTQSNMNLDEVLVSQPKDANGNFYCGGVRIKKIATTDPYHPGKNDVKIYTYNDNTGKSSGIISNTPVYAFFQPKTIYYYQCMACPPVPYYNAGYFVVHSSSQLDLTGESNHVYYKEVSVQNGVNAELGSSKYNYQVVYTPVQPSQQQSLPFATVWQQDWKNMLLTEVNYKKEGSLLKPISDKTNSYLTMWYNPDIVGYKSAESPIVEEWNQSYDPFGNGSCYIRLQSIGGLIIKQYATSIETFISDYTFLSSENQTTYSSDNTSQISSATAYTINPASFQPSSVKTTGREGRETEKRMKYAANYELGNVTNTSPPFAQGIKNLQQKNISGAPVEETSLVNGSVVSSSLNMYDVVQPRISRTYDAELAAPVSQHQFQFSDYQGNNIVFDNRYKEQIDFTLFDNAGNPVYQKYKDAHAVAVLWDYNQTLPVAEIKLGNPDKDFYSVIANDPRNNIYKYNFAYTSFEGTNNGNWQGINQSGISNPNAIVPSGNKVYEISAGPMQFNYNTGHATLSDYYLFFWKAPGANISVNASAGNIKTDQLFTNKQGWVLMRYTLTQCSQVSISGNGLIDEVRLFTTDSRMSTNTYIPGRGVQCQTDVNGRIIYYYYDGLGRLNMVKDMEGNILKTYDYQFQK